MGSPTAYSSYLTAVFKKCLSNNLCADLTDSQFIPTIGIDKSTFRSQYLPLLKDLIISVNKGNVANLPTDLVTSVRTYLATPAAPAPTKTILQSERFFPTTFTALIKPAKTTTAVPC